MNNMNKVLVFVFVLLTALSALADVEINENTFPDDEFRTWVLAQSYGQDGMLTEEEIANVSRITVEGGRNIQSLKGIEYFTALTYLNCGSNHLSSLDVSNNTALMTLNCNNNHLSSLDVSNNTQLTKLNCGSNQLISLDVTMNTALTNLACSSNQLTSLNTSKDIALIMLSCNDNQLTELDVSNNVALTTLACQENQLTTLDVSKNIALKILACHDNYLTKLELNSLPKLESLSCCNNKLERIIVSDCPKLEQITCHNNQIRGKAMDEFIEGLPVVPYGWGHLCIVDPENEQNVMTKAQVAAAKAKGWTPFYKYGAFGNLFYTDYEGTDEPNGITSPLVETEEGALFDLQGRKLQGKPTRGIYIENGKKKVVGRDN